MKADTVSVIIPIFNGEKYLAAAIESALAQTHRPLEIIVVDDGSIDASRKIADRFPAPVRSIFQPHQGPGVARNHGIQLAGGSFCAFLDADDLWIEDKLARQMHIFQINRSIDMVFGQIEQFHSPELSQDVKAKIKGHGEVLAGLAPGAVLIKRESFFRAGPFKTHWRVGEFIDWYLKAIEQGLKSHMIPEIVTKRRLHGGNMTMRDRTAMLDYVRIVKASLDRRRNNESTERSV